MFTHLVVPREVIDASLNGANLEFGDVIVDVSGLRHGLGFVVFVRDGALDMLEGYTFGDDRWPKDLGPHTLRLGDPR